MENTEAHQKNDKTEIWLFGILILLGIIALVSLIFVFTSEKNSDDTDEIIVPGNQKQADEALRILNVLKQAILDEEKMKTAEHIKLINSIADGENFNVFGNKFTVFPEDYGNFEYYRNSDIVFHKGGGKKNEGVEFYIEAKSSIKHGLTTQETVNEELCIRLYSDGSIERTDN